MKTISVELNLADSEFMAALRLVVGVVCSAADVDVDASEDMKVCVTESCLLLKSCGYKSIKAELSAGDGVTASVTGYGGAVKEAENEFSLALISALVSSCEISRESGVIKTVTIKL